MPPGLFRVLLPDGSTRLARGDSLTGPAELLALETTIDGLVAAGVDAIRRAAEGAEGFAPAPVRDVPPASKILAPVESQEVWAAGVTYRRSRDARIDESETAPDVYDRVYSALRPELFFKSPAWRVRATGEPIGIRADSEWDVPEPELALLVTPDLQIAGYLIANDVSSRTIEGENPLYLPQAKLYDGSCALGPCIVPVGLVEPPFAIRLSIVRDGSAVVSEETSTSELHRTFQDLVDHLGWALTLPFGAVLLTGTGIVPEPAFTLSAGDVVRIEISGLGVLENRVERVGGEASRPGAATQPESR